MPRAMIRTKDANRNAMLLITFDVPDANGSRHAGSRRPSVLGTLTCGTLAPSPANCHPTPPQPERGQARLQQHYVQPRQAGVGRRGELSECWATICVEPTRYIYRIKIPPIGSRYRPGFLNARNFCYVRALVCMRTCRGFARSSGFG